MIGSLSLGWVTAKIFQVISRAKKIVIGCHRKITPKLSVVTYMGNKP